MNEIAPSHFQHQQSRAGVGAEGNQLFPGFQNSQSSALRGPGSSLCPWGKQQLLHHAPLLWNLGTLVGQGCFGTWSQVWVWGDLSFLGTLRQQQGTRGAALQNFLWHGGLAALQGEENPPNLFLFRFFSTRTSQISAFRVPQGNPHPIHQHRQLQGLLELSQAPRGG